MESRCDFAIVGAGVIGLSIADRLAGLGHRVVVFDAAEPAQGASWAGSGALSLIMPDRAPPALRPLAGRSTSLWPSFAADLEERAGMAIEFCKSGLLRLVIGDEDPTGVEQTEGWLRTQGVPIEPLSRKAAQELSPLVPENTQAAYYQSELYQVRPPRLLKALLAAASRRKVLIRGHEPVQHLLIRHERVCGVETATGPVHAGAVILAAGAHAGNLVRQCLGLTMPVRPIRGQIVLLEGPPVAHSPLLLGPNGSYLIPRADGRILAGSTFENTGFDRRVTAAGVQAILSGALHLAPTLAQARLVATWAGLRPESPDRLPYLGRFPGVEGLVVACGHFRDGLLLTSVTAHILADLVTTGRTSVLDMAPYAPERNPGNWLN